jgi:hypothetical protein
LPDLRLQRRQRFGARRDIGEHAPASCAASLAARCRSCSACTASRNAFSPASRDASSGFLPVLVFDFGDLRRDGRRKTRELSLQQRTTLAQLRLTRARLSRLVSITRCLLDERHLLLDAGERSRGFGDLRLEARQRARPARSSPAVVSRVVKASSMAVSSAARSRAAPPPVPRARRSAR